MHPTMCKNNFRCSKANQELHFWLISSRFPYILQVQDGYTTHQLFMLLHVDTSKVLGASTAIQKCHLQGYMQYCLYNIGSGLWKNYFEIPAFLQIEQGIYQEQENSKRRQFQNIFFCSLPYLILPCSEFKPSHQIQASDWRHNSSTNQRPGFWWEMAGLEFISLSQIQGDYNFSITCIRRNIFYSTVKFHRHHHIEIS